MLNYFTTWNIILLATTNLKKNNSRAMTSLCGCVSMAGLAMLYCEMRGKKRKWKNTTVSSTTYVALEMVVHQLPFIIILQTKKTGNALKSLIPVLTYCCIVRNPYRICGKKVKNYHGIILISCASLIVNKYTGFKYK